MPRPSDDERTLDDIFQEGRGSCIYGSAKSDNPHERHSPRATAWERGWLSQHQEMMLDLSHKQRGVTQ